MNLYSLFENMFRWILLILIVYYICKRNYKVMKAVVLVLLLSFLPALLQNLVRINTDAFSRAVYCLVLFMALYLGSSLGFYDRYKWWDRVVHFLSGVGFVGFGMAVTGLNTGIAAGGMLLFGFTFSITLHVFWEVLEYWNDCLTRGNAQRWQKIHDSRNHVSEQAIQPAGLVDTMNDLICCIAGALLAVMIWWMVL